MKTLTQCVGGVDRPPRPSPIASHLRVAAYIRVSTDDQALRTGPEGQRKAIEAWARANDIEVVSWHQDEGTSGSISPLQRQVVLEAVDSCKTYGADGIVVDNADRWTRGGLEDGVLSRAALAKDHRLSLYVADMPFGMDQMLGSIVLAIRDSMAAEWLRKHKERVTSGLRDAKGRGWPQGRPGRPAKPCLVTQEMDLIAHEAARRKGMGLKKLAWEVSKLRGAHEVADPGLRYERTVGETWLRKQLAGIRSENPRLYERSLKRWPAIAHINVDDSEEASA